MYQTLLRTEVGPNICEEAGCEDDMCRCWLLTTNDEPWEHELQQGVRGKLAEEAKKNAAPRGPRPAKPRAPEKKAKAKPPATSEGPSAEGTRPERRREEDAPSAPKKRQGGGPRGSQGGRRGKVRTPGDDWKRPHKKGPLRPREKGPRFESPRNRERVNVMPSVTVVSVDDQPLDAGVVQRVLSELGLQEPIRVDEEGNFQAVLTSEEGPVVVSFVAGSGIAYLDQTSGTRTAEIVFHLESRIGGLSVFDDHDEFDLAVGTFGDVRDLHRAMK